MKKLFLLIGLVVFISTHAKAQSENIVENINENQKSNGAFCGPVPRTKIAYNLLEIKKHISESLNN